MNGLHHSHCVLCCICLLQSMLYLLLAEPFEDEYTVNKRAGIAQFLFDGDIDLRSSELEMVQRNSEADQRNPTVLFTNWETDERLRWPVDKLKRNEHGNLMGPMINYTLDWRLIINPNAERWMNNILTALKNIEAATCIRFRNSSEGDHLHFYWGVGCHSAVGRIGGKQWVSLGSGCWMVNAVHEVLHAMGAFHEQNRRDRDAFIRIHRENMLGNMMGQFAISDNGSPTGIPYDYGSVMHYNPKAFSSNEKETIETIDKNYQNTIGWRKQLSFLDAKALNHRYCDHVCDDYPWHAPDCRNGGYANPSKCTECICPEGYSPPFCDTIQEGRVELLEGKVECPGVRNILLTEMNSSRYEIRWINTANFTCYWRVQAPADYYIEVKLDQLEGFACQQACYYNYVEIKYGSKANAGPRFCCSKPSESLYTEAYGHDVIIIAHANLAGNYTIGLRYSITK